MVGIVNAKNIWKENQAFWSDKSLALDQETARLGVDAERSSYLRRRDTLFWIEPLKRDKSY